MQVRTSVAFKIRSFLNLDKSYPFPKQLSWNIESNEIFPVKNYPSLHILMKNLNQIIDFYNKGQPETSSILKQDGNLYCVS